MNKGHGKPKGERRRVQISAASNANTVRPEDIEPKSEKDNTQHEEPKFDLAPINAMRPNPAPMKPSIFKHKWDKPLEWWKPRLEIVGIIFAIGYAVVTWLQWRDLRHNFAVDERAWLKIGPDAAFPPTIDQLVGISGTMLRVDNIGKSASLRTNVQAMFEIVKRDQPPTLAFKDKHEVAELGLLFPNDQRRFWTYIYDAKSVAHPLSKEDVGALARGETYLAFYAEALYMDQFGGKHWTRMCSWKAFHPGKFRSEACVAWNSVGEGTPPPQ